MYSKFSLSNRCRRHYCRLKPHILASLLQRLRMECRCIGESDEFCQLLRNLHVMRDQRTALIEKINSCKNQHKNFRLPFHHSHHLSTQHRRLYCHQKREPTRNISRALTNTQNSRREFLHRHNLRGRLDLKLIHICHNCEAFNSFFVSK